MDNDGDDQVIVNVCCLIVGTFSKLPKSLVLFGFIRIQLEKRKFVDDEISLKGNKMCWMELNTVSTLIENKNKKIN